MATLTAAGVNCSNGTLDGQYTGTSGANTSYPIGSYLGGVVNGDGCTFTAPNPNNAFPGSGLRILNGTTFIYGTAVGLAVSGTWRSRASSLASSNIDLCQRVA